MTEEHNVIVINKTPKGTCVHGRRCVIYRLPKSIHWYDLCMQQWPKKKIKETLQWQTGCTVCPDHWRHRIEIKFCVGLFSGIVLRFKFH